MSREEAHKLLDKLFDMKYSGSFIINFFKGGVSNIEVKQSVKACEQMVLVVG